MRSHGRPWLAFAVALLAACSAWALGPAKLVAGQSQIGFVSKQMGVPVEGTFKRFEASVAFDPRKPQGGTVALQIDTASASFGIAQTDAELPRATWFDAAHHPRASFRSNTIKALGGGRFEVAGTLTLKGQTHDLVVPVAITQSDGQSVATGSFTLKRLEYKIGDGEWTDTSMVADEVQVRFKLTFTDLGPL